MPATNANRPDIRVNVLWSSTPNVRFTAPTPRNKIPAIVCVLAAWLSPNVLMRSKPTPILFHKVVKAESVVAVTG